MKKILVIHTGGTFGMMPMKPNDVLAPGKFQDQIHTLVPEITRIAHIQVEVLFNLDSSDIGIEEWDKLAGYVFGQLENYDGFVIIHGTDTMVYTAAALSFSLRNLNKPVILTGAQRPLSKLRNDAGLNLIDAVELATMDIPEVLIVFGQQILRGNRAKKISIDHYRAFHSSNFPSIGEIGVGIHLDEMKILKPLGKPYLLPGFSPKAVVLSVQPSMNPNIFRTVLDEDIRVIIIQGFGAGNFPIENPSWIPFIEKAIAKDKILFIGSHSISGSVNLNLYSSAKSALESGAYGIGSSTIEAAYVKIQKILALTSNKTEILEMFSENWAGEF